MKVTMCFGTFDNFHPGHANYLQQVARYKLPMLVVIARDRNVERIKGHSPQQNEGMRLRSVNRKIKELGFDGRAILGQLNDRWAVIKKHRPQLICLGYDQHVDLKTLKDLIVAERFFCEIKRLKAFQAQKYKSKFCINYEK